MYFHQIDRILYCVLDVFILVYYMKGVLSFNTYVLDVLLLKEVLIKHIYSSWNSFIHILSKNSIKVLALNYIIF